MNVESLLVLQAAALHDIGRLLQRAGENGDHAELGVRLLDEFPNLFSRDSERSGIVKGAILRHHRAPASRLDRVVQAADRLAAMEGDFKVEGAPSSLLIPPTALISFLRPRLKDTPVLAPASLALDESRLFPRESLVPDPADLSRRYGNLIDGLKADLRLCGSIDDSQGLITLTAILRKHTSLIPHTIQGEDDEPYFTERDVSLFDHLKLTCAVAACLNAQNGDDALFSDSALESIASGDSIEAPLARLVRGEVSGIQPFIYRIAQAESDKGGSARRLRGRSFYIALIVDVIADWLIRKLDLPHANILFCGGGRFDLLAPASIPHFEVIKQAEADLNKWLLNRFHGELSIQITGDPAIHGKDFFDFSNAHREANERIAELKRRRFDALLNERFFLGWSEEAEADDRSEVKPIRKICPVCRLSELNGSDAECEECRLHGEIGRALPKRNIQFLAAIHGQAPSLRYFKAKVEFGEPFDVTIALAKRRQAESLMSECERLTLFRLNDANDFIFSSPKAGQACDFKFIGNAAPVARRTIKSRDPEREDLKPGDVFDFSNIARELKEGAALLTVLKMDVDHLGMLFGTGLQQHTLLRISALSRSLDLFFNGWLNKICERVSKTWIDQSAGVRDSTDNLFYIVYSGGDDMLIIGPWEQTLTLAREIRADFGKYCGNNPNVTLSGGAVLVKPHFPIHRFAPLADEELKRSKNADVNKDRFTVFNHSVPWEQTVSDPGFDQLLGFAEWLSGKVEERKIPKSLVYLLLRLYNSHLKEDGSWRSAVWLPKFTYAAVRRVPLQIEGEKLGEELIAKAQQLIKHIRIPVSYVSLKTRKE